MADQLTGLLSPFLRSRRTAAVAPFLGQGPLLDIGCGTGALARDVDSTRYLGVDQDEESISIAKNLFPAHRFLTLPEFAQSHNENQFERIVGLAVIEHVEDPQKWLTWLRTLLKPGGQIVLTTPHPSIRGVHEFGGHIGLFSREGAMEHRELINRDRMIQLAETSGFRVRHFRRFLSGCNQLFVLEATGG
ncbi:MAG: methyltransferase type 11 [Verrucomicrobia bacterium]|nr:MAG: methyltransferase type 11 [Verrucomicrobiota bacterium]PYL93674.1 MAG: methyltransferase type 11 [Verrucomicrobiota bacterium]